MINAAERGMRFDQNADSVFLLSNVGGGKRTFCRATLAAMEQRGAAVQVLEPSDGGLVTKQTWNLMRRLYSQAGKPGRFQDWVGAKRASNEDSFADKALLYLANREVTAAASEAKMPIVSYHGMLGQGIDRFLLDADEVPEPRGVDAKTTVLVPTNSAREHVLQYGEPKGIEIVGFVVPDKLSDFQRAGEIVNHFAEGEPTPEDPLRAAFLFTGQLAHGRELSEDVLGDPRVQQLILEGRLVLDVYACNSHGMAKKVFTQAQQLDLNPVLTTEYQPENKYGVQVYWNPDENQAIDDSFAIIENAHVMITPPAERTPFAATTYPIFLPPVKGNAKMEGNMRWLQDNDIAGQDSGSAHLGDTLIALFDHKGAAVRKHFATAYTVFDGGSMLHGAVNTANIVLGSNG